jgi:glycosyltransferase involved in cell wall biosynthesis
MCVDLFYPYLLGGTENRYFALGREFARTGDEVDVLTMSLSNQPSYEELEDGRLRITRVGFKPQPFRDRSLTALLAYTFSSLFRSEPLRSCDFLDINWTGAIPGKLAAMRAQVPCCVTFHDVFRGTPAASQGYGPIASLAEMTAALAQRSGRFIAVSEATKRRLHLCLGLRPDQIHVVPNGVDLADYPPQSVEKPSRKTGTKSLVCVGRLAPYKNVGHAIETVKILLLRGQRVDLQIIGDGPDEARLRKLAEELGVIEHVNFLGFASERRAVIKLMSDADVLVSPSMFEGFGMVLLEGMAAGTPVVAYDLEAYRDFAVNQQNSLLVRPGRVDLLAEAVQSVLSDEQLSSSMIRSGLETARRFSWKEIARRARDVYSLIARNVQSTR